MKLTLDIIGYLCGAILACIGIILNHIPVTILGATFMLMAKD